ncbi:hypothetical protein [Paenibacillus sp. GCM10012303]|uniref:hypothetical protein n=1 Tax=Paenibacillus sp. GCM10012303 TaxID=3317340 RepID=UPI0036142F34
MSEIIPCRVQTAFDQYSPGEVVFLDAAQANRLEADGVVEVLLNDLDSRLIGDQIVELANREMEMLRELIAMAPDEVKRQAYKRRLRKLEQGDLRP